MVLNETSENVLLVERKIHHKNQREPFVGKAKKLSGM